MKQLNATADAEFTICLLSTLNITIILACSQGKRLGEDCGTESLGDLKTGRQEDWMTEGLGDRETG